MLPSASDEQHSEYMKMIRNCPIKRNLYKMDHFGIDKKSSKIDAKLSDTWESLSFLPSVKCSPEHG